jgi:hypothetical protein
MTFSAELGNKEEVLNWYDTRDNSCYIICTGVKIDGKTIFSKWVSDDNIAGSDKLKIALEFIEKNLNNYNVYTIISFPYYEGAENEKIKEIEGETIRFKFHNSYTQNNNIGAVSVPSVSESQNNYFGKELILMMQKQNDILMQRIDSLQMQMQQKEEEEEDEDEDEEIEPLTGKERLIGALATIVEKPEFTDTMFGLIGMVVNKFIPDKTTSNEQ